MEKEKIDVFVSFYSFFTFFGVLPNSITIYYFCKLIISLAFFACFINFNSVFDIYFLIKKTKHLQKHTELFLTIQSAKRDLQTLKENAIIRLTQNATVLLATIAAIGKIPSHAKAHTLIVDEAGCMEEISFAPLLQLAPANLVLIGDHKQLPPLVFSELDSLQQQNKRVSRSLMERLVDCGLRFRTLTVQYRMHRDVMELVSKLFYDGKLVMGTILRSRPRGLLWADSTGEETKLEDGRRVFNSAEVEVCDRIYSRERGFNPGITIKIIVYISFFVFRYFAIFWTLGIFWNLY